MPNQNDVLLNNGTNWVLTSIEDFSLTINSTLPLADSGTQGLLSPLDFSKLQNTSNTNSGDETATTILTKIGNGSIIDSSYLPSYVDDVLEFLTLSVFPLTGESNKIYIDLSDNKQYRWSGSAYIQITNGYISSTDDIQEGSSNLFHTNQRVIDSVLTGLSTTSGVVLETDSVLTAISKLSNNTSSTTISITVADFQLLNGIYTASTTYHILDADINLYGGTEIYLTANNEGLLNERGLGKFYNPKYDQNVSGFNVWTNLSSFNAVSTNGNWNKQENMTANNNGATGRLFSTISGTKFIPLTGDWLSVTSVTSDQTASTANISNVVLKSYNSGDKVHWGGKTWIRNSNSIDGLVGESLDIYSLDSSWTVIPFDDIEYNIVYDEIKYDSLNDIIVYRNEQNSNIISFNKDYLDYNGWNPIKVFMWGNIFNTNSYIGIGMQNITNSYNENLNFRGACQIGLDFCNSAYQYNINFEDDTYQENILMNNYSNQYSLVFENGSGQYNLIFNNDSRQNELTFQNNKYQDNIVFNRPVNINPTAFKALNGVYSPSTTYKIYGCDQNLYDGGTEIYLTTNYEGLLNERGLGRFYNPKYDQTVAGFNVWTNLSQWTVTPTSGTWTPQLVPENITANNGATGKLFTTIKGNKFIPLTGDWSTATSFTGNTTGSSATLNSFTPKSYLAGDKVHWGGKTWTRNVDSVNGLVGSNSYGEYDLDTSWTVIPFNSTDYNVVYDEIIYDVENDKIVYRNEQNSNIVSSGYYSNAIKIFMWGNVYSHNTNRGIGNITITNESYNENINFRGSHQRNLTFNNGSYQIGVKFENGSSQDIITFDNYSYQQNLIFDNSAQNDLSFDNYSRQIYGIFDEVSRQEHLSFNNYSGQEQIYFYYLSKQYNLTFNNSSKQINILFENNSEQYKLTFDNGAEQRNLTEKTGKQQYSTSFYNFASDRLSTPMLANESNLEFKGDLPTITSLNSTTDKIYVKQNNQVKEITIIDLGIIRRTKTVTNSSIIVPYIPMTDSIYILTGSNTITLPSAVDNENVYRVIRSSLQSVYVASTNDELFNDANGPIILNINRMQIEFISDGVNWIY